jgi:hypothetical protein
MKKTNYLLLLLACMALCLTACDKESSKTTPLEVLTLSADGITNRTAQVSIEIKGNTNGYSFMGICCSTEPFPTFSSGELPVAVGISSFALTSLSPDTRYYARAYIRNDNNDMVAFGNEISFSTPDANYNFELISTKEASSITAISAISGGVIPSSGNPTSSGICWSTSPLPTVNNQKVSTSGKDFLCTMTNLTPNTMYYVRAYAYYVNYNAYEIHGYLYGNQITFTTTPVPHGTITLTTSAVSSIKSLSAMSGGSITSSSVAVSERGICYSTSYNPAPSVSDYKVIADGTNAGFSCAMPNLLRNTTYYVRAYATNNSGTYYGNLVSFTTPYYSTGESWQGGVIAYIDATLQHGIIVATNDLGAVRWNNGTNVTTNATGTATGTGATNTAQIVAIQGNGTYAASICASLTLNGYSDWVLPSRIEATSIRSYLGSGNYWTSTESSVSLAYIAYQTSPYYSTSGKVNTYEVRPIRYF